MAGAVDEPLAVTEPADTPEHDPLLDEALDWVVRLKSGEPTNADLAALQCWRRQSLRHEEAFRSAARLWRLASTAARELAHEESAADAIVVPQTPPPPIPLRRPTSRRAFLGGAIAASVAGYMVVHPPFGLWPSLGELSADYRTAKGERRKVALAPDVSLELNTQTSVAVRSAQDALQIELISGEAAVASNLQSSKPLVVLAAGGRITAVEANFNARCIDGTVSVTCLDGAVDVQQGERSVRIGKGEQVSYSAAGLSPSAPVDPSQVTAWQAGLLIFRGMPLAEVVDEINRYRPGKIIITSADLKRRVVDGIFRIDRLDNLVAQVQHLFGARATSLPGGVVLLG